MYFIRQIFNMKSDNLKYCLGEDTKKEKEFNNGYLSS